jgi:dTDP-4-amino-4,6-dideoxygalactose transaminase
MDLIMNIAEKYNLIIIEDAAHAFGSGYKNRLLGTIGHLGCISFHETKVIHCGEGGMLVINDRQLSERAEIIWDKGTNRSQFHNGKVQKYEWLDIGSSFLLSDINAAFLFSQLEKAEELINHNKEQWELYYSLLKNLEKKGLIKLPVVTGKTQFNYSGFYLEARNIGEREALRNYLIERGIQAVTHYLDLSESPYILKNNGIQSVGENENSKRYENTILRLPFYYSLKIKQIREVADAIKEFYIDKEFNVQSI